MNNLILTKEENRVLTITLNRFDKKNALDTTMYNELSRLFTYANNEEKIHCLVIQGNDNCFCAGNDLKDFIECSQKGDALAALEFINILAKFNKPPIAGVAGVAVGIGTTLLLHCDMVIAANNSIFKLPFTQLGLCPEAGSSLLLTQKVGQNKAFELMILGDKFSAEQAHRYGIVNQVCQPNELLSIVESIAIKIAKLPTDSVMTSRKLIRQSTQPILYQAMQNESIEFERLVKTDTCTNILNQFFNR